MRRFVALLVLAAGVLAAALPALGADATVNLVDAKFQPQTVTISVGEKVTWINSSGGFHNVSFDDGSFRNGDPASSNWTAERTFTAAGSFAYHCDVHGAPGGVGMSGTVVVVEAGATPAPTPPPAETPTPEPTSTPAPQTPPISLSALSVRRVVRAGRLRGSVRSGAGRLSIAVRAGKRRAGRRSVAVTSARRVSFSIRLDARSRRSLARRHRLRVLVSARLQSGTYTVSARSVRVTLRTS
jgi:plastocyanin